MIYTADGRPLHRRLGYLGGLDVQRDSGPRGELVTLFGFEARKEYYDDDQTDTPIAAECRDTQAEAGSVSGRSDAGAGVDDANGR